MESQRFTVVSLFTGGMGLDLGIEQTGRFRLLACVEKVPAFCDTIRRNRDARRSGSKSLRVYQTDIADLDLQRIKSDLELGGNDLDMVIGGPPCQAFSVFGKRRGIADSRGKLIFEFCRAVGYLKPRVFIMENVRGLLSLKQDGSKRKGSLFELVQHKFADIGYQTDCFVVNAANYGAPQIRERIIVIGNRFNLKCDFPRPTHSNRAKDGLLPFTTLGDAIRGKPDPDPTMMDFSARKKHYLAMVPPGGNWRSLPIEIQKESMGKTFYLKGGRSAYWRKLSFEFPSPTIVTMPNHAGTSLCHPEELRPLTVGECLRVQGFPDNWEFVGSPSEKYQQVGNAVPIVLGVLAGRVAAELLDKAESASERLLEPLLPHRIVHLRPHVRTRWWWKNGEVINGIPYSEKPRPKQASAQATLFDRLD
ncbi:MAG: DNA cytosine methyltransferase [Gemmataceae bacterium]